jgi:hypothetical protein
VFCQHFMGTVDDHDPALSGAFASDREVILFNNAGQRGRTAMIRLNVDGARCEALFASGLQRSDAPTAASVAEAISGAVRRFGTRGCAGRMAQEFGDHPQAAAERMRWIRRLAARTTARPQANPRLAGPGLAARYGMTYQETGSGDERDV